MNATDASAVTGDNDGVREKLRIIAAAINASATLPWRAEVWGYHLAVLAKSGNLNAIPANITTDPPAVANPPSSRVSGWRIDGARASRSFHRSPI